MITSIEEFKQISKEFHDDLIDRANQEPVIRKPSHSCYRFDKPLHIIINNEKEESQVIEKEDHYELLFPCYGTNSKQYTGGFCWVVDDDTVFYLERPYKGRVVKLLRQLFPEKNIRSIHNDLTIDGFRIGPTFMCGQITDFTINENPESSSLCYCLRWSNPEGLNDYFAGDPHHEERKTKPNQQGSLDMFIKNMTKEEFETALENLE